MTMLRMMKMLMMAIINDDDDGHVGNDHGAAYKL